MPDCVCRNRLGFYSYISCIYILQVLHCIVLSAYVVGSEKIRLMAHNFMLSA